MNKKIQNAITTLITLSIFGPAIAVELLFNKKKFTNKESKGLRNDLEKFKGTIAWKLEEAKWEVEEKYEREK